jgi:hypothetical protein
MEGAPGHTTTQSMRMTLFLRARDCVHNSQGPDYHFSRLLGKNGGNRHAAGTLHCPPLEGCKIHQPADGGFIFSMSFLWVMISISVATIRPRPTPYLLLFDVIPIARD